MELIWIILQYLFPRDPVGHVREMLRAMMQFTLSRLEHPLCEAMLKIDGNRLCFETDIVGMEQMLADLIHFRACQIANIAWRRPPGVRIYTAIHARSTDALLRRFEALARDFHRIEHLAKLRAKRLARMRDQNPLNLPDHLAGAVGCIEQREMHHVSTRTSACDELAAGDGGFRFAQSTLRAGACRNARGPPADGPLPIPI